MPTFVITGSYSVKAAADMLDKPRDREQMARGIVEAAGGTLNGWWATTGPTDFLMIVTTDDIGKLMAGVMVATGSGNFSGLQTQRAFSSQEFSAIQEHAQGLKSAYG